MRSYTLKENRLNSAVSEIFRYTQTKILNQNIIRIEPVKYSINVGKLILSRLGDQVGSTKDMPPRPDTRPKLTGILKNAEILRGKTMDNKFIYIPNNDKPIPFLYIKTIC